LDEKTHQKRQRKTAQGFPLMSYLCLPTEDVDVTLSLQVLRVGGSRQNHRTVEREKFT